MTRTLLLVLALAFTPVAATQAETAAPETPLIARNALFGNPEKTQARISPDGRHLSWIAPRDGVLNVWVAPAGDLGAARPVTNDRQRGIRQHFWAERHRTSSTCRTRTATRTGACTASRSRPATTAT